MVTDRTGDGKPEERKNLIRINKVKIVILLNHSVYLELSFVGFHRFSHNQQVWQVVVPGSEA